MMPIFSWLKIDSFSQLKQQNPNWCDVFKCTNLHRNKQTNNIYNLNGVIRILWWFLQNNVYYHHLFSLVIHMSCHNFRFWFWNKNIDAIIVRIDFTFVPYFCLSLFNCSQFRFWQINKQIGQFDWFLSIIFVEIWSDHRWR